MNIAATGTTIRAFFLAALAAASVASSYASDHLDSPKVVADPRMDIGDLYAWTSSDGRHLNLAMTIVGHSFSKEVEYAFHVDSGSHFGSTTATTDIVCRFQSMTAIDCTVGKADRVTGDPSSPAGVAGRHGHARVYAGLRDDPFFNNVKGSRDAFDFVAAALRAGVPRDEAGCPQFDGHQAPEILRRWKQTNGEPGRNFLRGWTPASIVVVVDLPTVSRGGPLLAVWADTSLKGIRVDRAGRPLTGNALLAPLEADDISDELKLKYNEATPATASAFIREIEKSLALYDGYDGKCGNQLFIDTTAPAARRYRQLATGLADDRLWVNSASARCIQLFAVEIAAAAGTAAGGRKPDVADQNDCGGRTPNYDAVNVYRSFLANGTATGIDDGVHQDELVHSNDVFPFLAAPAAAAVKELPPVENYKE